MNQRDYEAAITREVEEWPGVSVEFKAGSKHPKAAFTYQPPEGGDPVKLSRPYAGTPSDSAFGVHQMLGDMRRVMRQLGAARAKPEPSKDEEEAAYRKPNDGREKRPAPVAGDKAAVKPDVVDQLVSAGAISADDAAQARAAPRQEVFVIGDTGAGMVPASGDRQALIDEALARVAAIVDGIYFDLPADIYHAVPRLSASGLQKLCVSAATFWRGSWLDPDRPPIDEEQTLAQMLGKAYHTARLEPHLFEATYVRELDKAEYPEGTLFLAREMSAVCEEIGLKKSGSLEELTDRLADHGYPHPLWPIEKRAWEEARRGRIPLPAKHYDQMTTDMGRIRENGPINELLVGGYAEVSIFWTDQYGIKMKQRIDYLALAHWADFKTFDNSRGKVLQQALSDAMRYNRYYIQAGSYRDGVEAVRVGGLDIIGDATDDQRTFVAKLRLSPGELDCHYVFQEKGGVPNLVAREFPFYMVPYSTIFHEGITDDADRREAMRELTRHRTRLFMLAQAEIVAAKKMFMLYSQVYEPGQPWFPLEPRGTFTDEDFHPYWLESAR